MNEPDSILDKIIISKQTSDIEHFNPSEVVSNLLKNLFNREEDILRKRFGLSGQKKETLEEIGQSYKVTRERIRQIENMGIEKIKRNKNFKQIISPIESTLTSVIERHGGIMSEDFLIRTILNITGDTSLNRNCTIFIISELLNDKFKKVKESDELRLSWKLKITSDDLLYKTINKLVEIISKKNYPLKFQELLDLFKKDDFYQNNQNRLTDDIIFSYLEISQKISKNPFEEYGLKVWGSITPKRMNDKIYLILKKNKKPLHFTEITRLINEANFDKKKAYAPTVHNELILDNKYVLVGRGIYALAEWGYKPGVVSDILFDILKKTDKPMTREELVNEVLKQRMVKKNTIHLALSDKTKFKKTEDGTYSLNVDKQN